MKTAGNTTINLASDPFRRERAQTAGYALVFLALLCCLLCITGLILHSRAQASALRAQIDQQQAQLQTMQREQSRYSVVLSRPANQDVFAVSVFLNQLIGRRAVSWTKVFEDLTAVMPPNMRLLTIRLPQLPSEDAAGVDRVQLDMTVGTDRAETINTLLQNLEKSNAFGAATVVNRTPPVQNDPLYHYRVSVSYAQKL